MPQRGSRALTRSPRIEEDTSSFNTPLKRVLDEVSDNLGIAFTIQTNKGTDVPTRVNVDSGELEIYTNGKWQRIQGGDSSKVGSVQASGGKVFNRYIPAGTATKVTYTEEGRITSGESAGVADISGLQDALDDKADEVHSHSMSEVTGLGDALDDKADVSTDGLRIKVWDTGTSAWVYITCANGVLSVVAS